MNKKDITLSPEELDDVKDAERFRTRVLMSLKGLEDIPERVTKIETRCGMCQKVINGTIAVIVAVGVFCFQEIVKKR